MTAIASTDVTLSTSQTLANKTLTSATLTSPTVSGATLTSPAFTTSPSLTKTSTVTAAGTTTLTVTSAPVQEFTGTTTQTVKLPTTGVTAGMSYTIINNSTALVTVQSSGANTLNPTVGAAMAAVFTARIDTPTAAADWYCTGYTGSTGSLAYATAIRDQAGWIFAGGFRVSPTSTATAAGTTTLTSNFSATQVFTGSTTQTCVLPSSAVNGYQYTIVNNSTGNVTVNASGGATVATLTTNTSATFLALTTNPTTAAGWQASLVQASGLAAVDVSSTQTLTNKTLTAPKIAQINDANGSTMLDLNSIASAVNYLRIQNAATGGGIYVRALGSDSNIPLNLMSKGASPVNIFDGSGLPLIQCLGQTSSVNYWVINNAATGGPLQLQAVGTDTNISVNIASKGTGTVQANGVTVPTVSSTSTLTNKRVTARVGTTASSATPAINVDSVDVFTITALAADITSMTSGLAGTPTDGQPLLIRFKDNGTARAITWGASFTGNLLSTTVISKTHVQELVYDSASSKWAGTYYDATGY